MLPRLGSHRTAEPTVKGFWEIYKIGVKIIRFFALGVIAHKTADTVRNP